MTAYGDLEAVISNELDQCDRAIVHGNTEKALRDLREAVNKLNDIARKMRPDGNHPEDHSRALGGGAICSI